MQGTGKYDAAIDAQLPTSLDTLPAAAHALVELRKLSNQALDMGALEGKTVGEAHAPAPPPDTPQKTPRARKVRKPRTQDPQPLAGSSTVVDETSWTWRSLTESSAGGVRPVFTKDGR